MIFSTDYQTILNRVKNIDPVNYGKTRNFVDGAVTYLSPYISRGVISTKQVMDHVLSLGHKPSQIQKIIQELAWRDYWQQIWIEKKDGINQDLKHPQSDVRNHEISKAITDTTTGITAIDQALTKFYENGYLHNHIRMYLASLACNIGKSHWRTPARWMYYYLLDADWASNALSWQWVCGANANKKYYANQENINKYCYTHQKNTFIDVAYHEIPHLAIPDKLSETFLPDLNTPLPEKNAIQINPYQPLLIYNYYNLDPVWRISLKANRVLLLEPSVFQKYPISQNSVDFMMNLAKNLKDIQVYVGEFDDLITEVNTTMPVYFKEHPLNHHYKGIEDPRDWMFSVRGYYPSFFSFWKKCEEEWRTM